MGENIIIFYQFMENFIKNMKAIHELIRKQGQKVVIKNFKETKSLKKYFGY